MRPGSTVCILLAAWMHAANFAGQSKFDIGRVPPCAPAEEPEWQKQQTEFGGIHVKDPDDNTVSLYSAGRFGYFGLYLFPYNWLPLSDDKQIMCGRFARFDWNVVAPNENDWNIRIIPSKTFSDAFHDALPYSADHNEQVWSCDPKENDDLDRHSCNGGGTVHYENHDDHNCFEAELTPRPDRYDTPWFRKNHHTDACSDLVDYSICAYGPWVTESAW